MFNFYKLCLFGFALPEGERSFLNNSLTSLHNNEEIKDRNYFYRNGIEIITLAEESFKIDYRKIQDTKEEFRC